MRLTARHCAVPRYSSAPLWSTCPPYAASTIACHVPGPSSGLVGQGTWQTLVEAVPGQVDRRQQSCQHLPLSSLAPAPTALAPSHPTQVGESEPFISELLTGLSATIQDLETHQIHMFYEAVGLMISADTGASRGPGRAGPWDGAAALCMPVLSLTEAPACIAGYPPSRRTMYVTVHSGWVLECAQMASKFTLCALLPLQMLSGETTTCSG